MLKCDQVFLLGNDAARREFLSSFSEKPHADSPIGMEFVEFNVEDRGIKLWSSTLPVTPTNIGGAIAALIIVDLTNRDGLAELGKLIKQDPEKAVVVPINYLGRETSITIEELIALAGSNLYKQGKAIITDHEQANRALIEIISDMRRKEKHALEAAEAGDASTPFIGLKKASALHTARASGAARASGREKEPSCPCACVML